MGGVSVSRRRSTMEAVVRAAYGGRRLQVRKGDNLEAVVEEIIRRDLGDFCWSLDFDAGFIEQLFLYGFLPICSQMKVPVGSPCYVLLPKLHRQRCLLCDLRSIHVDRGARKRSKKYRISVDQAFPDVVTGCIEQHGESWLWPPIREAFSLLSDKARLANSHDDVAVRSIELWAEDGRLVAGELGFTCGSLYTSLTGFFREAGTGTLQVLALAALLLRAGCQSWDLGMGMAYKDALGAKDIDRKEFVILQRQLRAQTPSPGMATASSPISVAELINDLRCAKSEAPATEETVGQNSGTGTGVPADFSKQIRDMGFTLEDSDLRVLHTNCKGDIEQAVNTLLSQ